MSIYSEIKEQVGCRDVAEYYGYKVNRNGKMRCPFHDDKTPSMKVDKNWLFIRMCEIENRLKAA